MQSVGRSDQVFPGRRVSSLPPGGPRRKIALKTEW